ncbi:5-formyltetrahydrofolate cyclo-ligase [Massilia sp. DWR3-1-1]|uniref:5-formyltetrahydrofolate cyclo-ligase n=1 Tax=Massilia sp. DWR3-1-1 TaxID=2804559 RepID=UPI003CF2241F
MNGTPRIPRAPTEQPAQAPSETGSTVDKATLRRQLAARRAAIDGADKLRRDAQIGALLLAWCAQHRIDTLGVYWPLQGEVDLSATFATLADQGVQLVLPVVLARHAALGFAAWTPGQAMHKDAMGVAVPAQPTMVARPPALLVPCLGFDTRGFRLGYGGGYYDRTLAAPPRPLTAGIAYRCQLAAFDTQAHDVALDVVLTEAGAVAAAAGA